MNEPVTEKGLMQGFTKLAQQAGLKVDCLGNGRVDSKILIVSEAPGERECQMKMPFVGGSGAKLWTLLKEQGITRKDCYVTNICKRQVSLSTKTNARSPVPKPELEHWEGLFDWECDQLSQVQYVLCLGNFALHALIGETKITNWRGSVLDIKLGRTRRDVKVICAFNPAHVMRNPGLEIIFKFDLYKLGRVINGEFTPHIIRPRINPSPTEAIQFIDKMHDEGKPTATDIETMANETACVGLANDAHEGMCINFRDKESNRFTVMEEGLVRKSLQRFLSTYPKLIAQSGGFDSYWLGYKDRIKIERIWFDTLLAHHTLYPRLPHNLGFLTGMYTEHPYYKDEGKAWREDYAGDIDTFWGYNVKDCCITFAIHIPLLKELQQQKLDKFFFNHVMRLQPHLVSMTTGGILTDVEAKDELTQELEEDLDGRVKSFHESVKDITGDSDYAPNLQSPKQMSELFFKRLNLVGYGTSTNAANRERMRGHPNTTEECKKLLTEIDGIKEDQKFYGTYVTQVVDPDHRTRCEYKQFGTQSAPGRLSSSQVMWGSGANLQNQPHKMYRMYQADKGYMFSYFDLRQAEAKVVAYAWNVPALIENFQRAEQEEGFDIHRGNAARIFRLPYEDIPDSDWDEDLKPTKRYLGKRCVHGLNYRMGPPKLAEVCKIPLPQALEAWKSYHQAFPEIQQAWNSTVRQAREEKVLYSCFGSEGQYRRIIYLGMILEEDLDSVVAFVPQSTIGDKVSSVIYECHDDPDWPSTARMVLNIHDALIAIHKPEDKRQVQRIMVQHAESPILIRGQQVSIGTDVKEAVEDETGWHRWSTLEDVM